MAGPSSLSAANIYSRRSVTQTLLLAFVLVAAPAAAENYVQVEVEPDPIIQNRNTYLIDLDSFKPDPATKSTYFTYRSLSTSTLDNTKVTLEYDAIASCEKFALVNLRTRGVGNGYKFPVEERYTEDKGWLKEPLYQAKYLNKTAESAMLSQVCERVYPQVVAEMTSRPKDGIFDPGTLNYTLFSLGERNRYNLRLVKTRMELVGEYCGNLPYLQERLAALLKEVHLCGDRTDCFFFSASGLASGVADDAARISEWLLHKRSQPLDKERACKAQASVEQALRYEQERKDKMAAEKKAVDAFWGCVSQQAKALDDGISDSGTIAKVIVRNCDSAIYDVLEAKKTPYRKVTREEFVTQVEAGVIEVVLKGRRKKK